MSITSSATPFSGDPLALWGKLIIEEHHAALLKQLSLPKIRFERGQPDPLKLSDATSSFLPELKVAIIGAGIGGLYAALILDSLDIKYDIIEASGRIGGRLRTHRFKNKGRYDYFEEGAMRFPLPKKENDEYLNGTMKRLAELIEYEPLNRTRPLKEKLIPYYYSARDPDHPGFYYYNGIFQKMESDKDKGDFNGQGMGVDAAYIQAGSKAIYNDVINPFVRMMINDYATGSTTGWEMLKANDAYSIRGYMSSKYIPSYTLDLPPKYLSNDVVNWCNLLETSSAGLDRALTAGVFTAMAFANVGKNKFSDVDWVCFEGGSETLSEKIAEYLKSKRVTVKTGHRVTAIRETTALVAIPKEYPTPSSVKVISGEIAKPDIQLPGDDIPTKIVVVRCMGVTINGKEKHHYSHVISTLPPPVLRTIDLNEAGLNVLQKNALRGIDFGPAIKIGILFKSTWWTDKLGIVGGQSSTDLPIRNIVYPSYGVDSDTPSKVLIACYASTTDAFRLGALSAQNEKKVLKELVLRNLAEAHGHLDSTITYDYLVSEYEDMQVKDWTLDQHTMGAFGLFSPGEFEKLYAALNVPAADGLLHFAGEAISTRHGWVVGALDSSWRAVYEYLKVTGQTEKIKKFKEIWGENAEWCQSSTLVQDGPSHDLLDEHVALTRKAVPNLSP